MAKSKVMISNKDIVIRFIYESNSEIGDFIQNIRNIGYTIGSEPKFTIWCDKQDAQICDFVHIAYAEQSLASTESRSFNK
ncbi:hypothetical protein [Clostridium sp. LCP25S3_F10]|uniref:hypothetical protein n=1 Tax=Clostridium sp. LCP25S3_F10 TaxID=3438750 RepID=UPI003F8DD1B7